MRRSILFLNLQPHGLEAFLSSTFLLRPHLNTGNLVALLLAERREPYNMRDYPRGFLHCLMDYSRQRAKENNMLLKVYERYIDYRKRAF